MEEETKEYDRDKIIELMKKDPEMLRIITAGLGAQFRKMVGPVFTAKVQENGRVSIPSVERELNGIERGDAVFVAMSKVEEEDKGN